MYVDVCRGRCAQVIITYGQIKKYCHCHFHYQDFSIILSIFLAEDLRHSKLTTYLHEFICTCNTMNVI